MNIVFKKINAANRLINPFKDFSLDEIPLEIRFDPLTGQTGRVFDLFFKPERIDPSETVKRSEEMFCPFCPDALEKSTPMFPKEIIPEGRIKVGQASLIPNLVPFDKYAGVSILSHRHFVPIEDLIPETMEESFEAAQIFAKRIVEIDSDVNFISINWNYMPPAGSSIVHPHIQVNCGDLPTNELRMQVESSGKYFRENGSSFWNDFIKVEKENDERYIGKIDSTFWMMSYVPQGFLPDIWCIFSEHCSIIDLDRNGLNSFLKGLSKVFNYFNRQNILSFNMAVFSVKDEDHFRVNAKICPRLYPRPIGNSDQAYLQAVHNEPFCVRPPESLCKKVKEVFEA
ncbi:MAG TPA: hypothetical protein PK874_02340 [Desulfobacteraceae bacterium]|nr:hypothetical protein [Desulfobacteraceae bacterium]HPJ66421.1 hypothetical protein [Desulfobacteraceae bacterium]HPQ27343.1 hypothetical protein [Desulfobacteraceae bacterium]